MSLEYRLQGSKAEEAGVELPDFLFWEKSLHHSEHWFLSLCKMGGGWGHNNWSCLLSQAAEKLQ